MADCLNIGVPEVVAPIMAALAELGLPRLQAPPRMVLLGLEKITNNQDRTFDHVREFISDSARLWTTSPGRPMLRDRALEQLVAQNWQNQEQLEKKAMQGGYDVATVQASIVSQLIRADALLLADDWIVPCSMKIARREVAAQGWMDVPLWITGGRPRPNTGRTTFGPTATRIVASFGDTGLSSECMLLALTSLADMWVMFVKWAGRDFAAGDCWRRWFGMGPGGGSKV